MNTSLGFELWLLDLMSGRHKEEVLSSIGVSQKEMDELKAECRLRLPRDVNSPIDRYLEELGPPALTEAFHDETFGDSVAYRFTLLLWPHMHWVVHTGTKLAAGGAPVWGVNFQPQTRRAFRRFDARTVRPGVWTRDALRELAGPNASRVHDGWDESTEWILVFDGVRYWGKFVYRLLDDWRVFEGEP